MASIREWGDLAERVATGNRGMEDAEDDCVGLYMWEGRGGCWLARESRRRARKEQGGEP